MNRCLSIFFFFILFSISTILVAQSASENLSFICQDNTSPELFKLWSDPATWVSGKVPQKNEDITILKDAHILMDISPPPLGEVTVAGKLTFAERDLELSLEQLYVKGTVCIGTEGETRAKPITLTLTGERENSSTVGNRGILIMPQGNLIINAKATTVPFTKLAATADAGATSIFLEDIADWQIGDGIVVSSSDYAWRQAESRIITAITGNEVSFTEPLTYQHYGDL